MAVRSIACLLSLTLFGCTDDDQGRPAASTEPVLTSSSTGSGGGDDDGADDGVDDTAEGEDTTGAMASTTAPTDDDDTGTDDTGTDDTGGSTTAMGGEPGDWLLTIDDAASPPVVVRIDTNTGAGQTVCSLPATSSFNSLALSRDGTLYVHNAAQSRIERVDPCDCGFQIVGPTSAGTLEIGVDGGEGLLGLDVTLDALYALDPQTGLANAMGPLGLDFGGSALTWSETLPGAYAVDDATTQLYSLNADTGNAMLVATLSQMVTAPGLAYRTSDDTTYLCDGNTLYELDTGSGLLTEIGDIGLAGACTSLAAPFVAEACLD